MSILISGPSGRRMPRQVARRALGSVFAGLMLTMPIVATAQSTAQPLASPARTAPVSHPAPTLQEATEIAQSDGWFRARGDHERAYWFARGGAMTRYRVYAPTAWDGKAKLPLVLVLHGGGGDQDGPFKDGDGAIAKIAEQRGYILVSPMGFSTSGGFGSAFHAPAPEHGKAIGTPFAGPAERALSEQDTLEVLDRTIREYGADPSRIYLMGNSMGGAGTWYLGERYPERWAAISPSDGPPVPDEYPSARLKGVNVLAVHGDKDALLPYQATIELVARANAAGAHAQAIIVKDGTHGGAWVTVITQVFDFFDAHRKAD